MWSKWAHIYVCWATSRPSDVQGPSSKPNCTRYNSQIGLHYSGPLFRVSRMSIFRMGNGKGNVPGAHHGAMKGVCRFCGQSDLWALGVGGLMGFFDWPLLQGNGRDERR